MDEPGPWDERADVTALRPVRVWATVAAAWRLMQTSLPRAWGVWVVAGLAHAGLLFVQRMVGGGRVEPPDLPARLLTDLASALLLAPIGAAGLRSLLRPGTPAWRPDTGFRTYVAAVAALNFVGSQVLEAALLWTRAVVGPDPAQAGWSYPVFLVVWIAWGAVSLRLMLWPVAQLLGDRLGLRFAVAAMAGATLPGLAADLILSGAAGIVALLAGTSFYYVATLLPLLVAAAMTSWATAASLAVAAVVYRTRLGVEAEELARVFE